MAIIPWLEKKIFGDKGVVNDLKKLGYFGQGQYGEGEVLADEAIEGFGDIDRRATERLLSGRVLDPSVAKAYSMLRGGVRDRGAGERTAARASIAAQNAASGGRLSPEQQAALLALGDEGVGQQEFDALRDVGVQESRDTMAAVNDLNDRIERARGVRLQAGQFKMKSGQEAYINSILARLDRNKSYTGGITSIINTLLGKS